LEQISQATQSTTSTPSDGKPKRIEALDVLRGIAILGMALSGLIPDSLPWWMYHAQTPPPTREFNPAVSGITWVDLVFPFFLFSMGAAIPLSMQRDINHGDKSKQHSAETPTVTIIAKLLKRWGMLALFAILSQHLRLYTLKSSPTQLSAIVSLLGFAFIIATFIRIPNRKWISWLGFAGAFTLLTWWKYPEDKFGFMNWRIDIILMVLANVAFSGGLIWWLTKSKPQIRFYAVAVVAALFLGKNEAGWVQYVWNFDPIKLLKPLMGTSFERVPVLYNMEFHKYLLIVLPGTFVGDWLLTENKQEPQHNQSKAIPWLTLTAVVISCIGLTTQDSVPTKFFTAIATVACGLAIQRLASTSSKETQNMVSMALGCLTLGFILEPIGGGIHKDPSHLSYYAVTTGLAILTLVALRVLMLNPSFSRRIKWVEQCGQNPMFGYAIIANLIPGLNFFSQYGAYAGEWFRNPWLLTVLDAGVKTLFLVVLASHATRKGWFLRT
jgi:predicted acyltransferase